MLKEVVEFNGRSLIALAISFLVFMVTKNSYLTILVTIYLMVWVYLPLLEIFLKKSKKLKKKFSKSINKKSEGVRI